MIITASEYFPVPHLMQVLDAEAPTVVEYVPTPQAVQTLASLAPVVAEYLPAPQVIQAEAPTFENLPAAQSAHVFHVAAVNEVNTPARTHR